MSEEDREGAGYVEFMRSSLGEAKEGKLLFDWKEDHSWLCRHKGLPSEAARNIHAFNQYPIPSLEFEWKEGDLLLEMEMCEYCTKWTCIYLARPCSEELQCRLIESCQGIASVDSDNESDSDSDSDSDR